MIIITTLALLFHTACGGAGVDNSGDPDGVTIVFAGDVLLDRGIAPII